MNGQIVWSPGVKLEDIERQVIIAAFAHFRKNKTATSAALGISVRTLETRLDKYDAESEKTEEKTNRQRQDREDFLTRSRGTPPAQYDTAATPRPPARYGLEPLANSAAQPAVSVPERKKIQGVLSEQAGANGLKG